MSGDGDILYTKLVEYCGSADKAKSKDIATCLTEACAKRGKEKCCDKMTVCQISDNAAAATFGKGSVFALTKSNVQEFEKQFCKKRLERAGKKPSDADVNAEVEKLRGCLSQISKKGPVPKFSKTGGVDKMTDASQYTGAHKERFDESGKGKGVAGREDRADNSGYVGNYKGAGTYDK